MERSAEVKCRHQCKDLEPSVKERANLKFQDRNAQLKKIQFIQRETTSF